MALVSANADFTNLVGRFTEAYNDVVLELVPEKAPLMKRRPFEGRDKSPGNLFHVPVSLSDSHGITFNSDGSAFAHTDVGSQTAARADAQVRGAEMLGFEQISLAAAARARGGVKQFTEVTTDVLKKLRTMMSFNLELSALYGQVGIAQTTDVTASGTTGTLVIAAAYWAPGMWKGSRGMPLDVYASLGSATPTNTNDAVQVTSVDYSTRTVSFTCHSSDAAGLTALTTSVIFRRGSKTGASTYNESLGLVSQLTTSGTVLNISNTTHDLWKGNTYSVNSGALNLHHLNAAFANAADGGLDQRALLIVSRRTWADLQAELIAGRYLDSSYSSDEIKNGSKRIMFSTQTGDIEVLPHPCMWEGFATAIPEENFLRIGSTDVTLTLPGMQGRDMLFILPNNAGYGVKAYTDQATILTTPNQGIWFTNIVNGTV